MRLMNKINQTVGTTNHGAICADVINVHKKVGKAETGTAKTQYGNIKVYQHAPTVWMEVVA